VIQILQTEKKYSTGQKFRKLGIDYRVSRHVFYFSEHNTKKSLTSKKPLVKYQKSFQHFPLKYFVFSKFLANLRSIRKFQFNFLGNLAYINLILPKL